MKHGIVVIIMLLLSASTAEAKGWFVGINSESPEKCNVSSGDSKDISGYSLAQATFRLVYYDHATPIFETAVVLIPDYSQNQNLKYISNKPAQEFYIDNNPVTKDPLLQLAQLRAGKRVFLKYENHIFAISLKGFSWAKDICAKLVKGK